MKKLIMIVTILALSGGVVANAQVNWQLKNESASAAAANGGDQHYLLMNTSIQKGIEYGSRSIGINLEWTDSKVAKKKWFIQVKRKPGATGPLKTGEKVALLFDGGGGYLKWEDRNVGVNLGWVDRDASEDKIPYEWEFRTLDNKLDVSLNTNTSFALFNHTNKTFLVYCHRGSLGGVNLGWSNSCSNCDYTLKERATDQLKEKLPQEVQEIIGRTKDATNLKNWDCK